MRRIVFAFLIAIIAASVATPVQANHGHHGHGGHHGGWGGGHGGGWNHHHHGGYGWGGYGWGGIGGFYGSGIALSVGYPRYSAYSYGCYSSPVFNPGLPAAYYYSSPGFGCSTLYGSYPGGYYSSYYGPGYGGVSTSGTYYVPSTGYLSYSAPTTYQPAELAYGPQAARQFLGLPRVQPASSMLTSTDALMLAEVIKAKNAAKKSTTSVVAKVRTSSPEYRRRADQFLAQGDSLFKEQQYHQAAQRYKLATEAAPDMPESYWRLGHAYMASNRIDLAAASFKRALRTGGDLGRDGFQLKKLYGDANVARESHLESLAENALARTEDADPLLVMAVTLHFSGEAGRAQKFFERVRQLSPEQAPLIAGFTKADGKAVLVSHDEDLEI